jgi:hypothetical protein
MTAEPPVRVFAFWTRKAALLSMQRDFEARLPQGCQAFGRGLAFHLPPANVDTLFLYSWAVACLTGNASLVRLPSQMPTIVQRVIDNYLWRAEAQDYADLFVSYPVDDAVSAALSAVADVRLVWGGDAKVALFHGWPVRLGGKTLAFPDRRSFAVLSGDALTRPRAGRPHFTRPTDASRRFRVRPNGLRVASGTVRGRRSCTPPSRRHGLSQST